ncbi:MAG TPA: carbohydrate-binding protein, partial [Polyangiaceae bacterium]|nr:carbohydrate-binding protein [Polyangiaceae bacterium]
EGPWFYRRNDLYYLIYPTGELPERIAYSTSSAATGPWTYRGEIMSNTSGHAFTNHPGIIDFKGHSYFFYHTQELPGGGGYKRSSAIEEFAYNQDGTIPTIEKTSAGVTESVEPLIPYYRTEGETMAWGQGVEVEDCSEGGRNLSALEDGDYVKVESVDFLTGALSFEASVASAGSGGDIELRLDAADGTLVGSCAVSPTGDWQAWDTVSCDVTGAEGIHDLFLVFSGGGGTLFNLDYYQFVPKDPLPTGSGGGGGIDGAGGAGAGAGGSAAASGGATSGLGGSPGAGGGAAQGSGGASPVGVGGSGSGGDGLGGGVPQDESGCSCKSTPEKSNGKATWLTLVVLLAAGGLNRRRTRA